MKLQDILNFLRKSQVVAPAIETLANQAGMAERNAERIEKIKQEMGEKWLMHPANHKTRLDEPRPV